MKENNETVKVKKGLIGFWPKVLIFIGEIILSLIAVGCILGGYELRENGFYNTSLYRILDYSFSNIFSEDARFLIGNVLAQDFVKNNNNCATSNIAYANVIQQTGIVGDEEYIENYYDEYGLIDEDYGDYEASVIVITDVEEEVLWSYGDEAAAQSSVFTFEYCYWEDGIGYTCHIALDNNLIEKDNYRTLYEVIKFCYEMRFAIYFIAFFAAICWLILYIFILRNAGYAKGSSVVKPVFESYIPLEINLLISFFALWVIMEMVEYMRFTRFFGVFGVIFPFVFAESYFILWSICIAIRVKSGYVWKTMILRWICIGIGKLFTTLYKYMSVIWKAVLLYLTVAITLIISVLLINRYRFHYYSPGYTAVCWLIFLSVLLALGIFIIYVSVSYQKINKKIEKLAKGDLTGELDVKHMLPVFKETADNLKTISGGIVISNEKRLASERTQSALITNVSHDIKTPLTSIINYADLISKENSDNERINEYAEVLGRQSTRLKRLLEDLIEVSKAQSGALEVNLQSCEVSTFINQAAGEFEEKLKACNLELITKGTELGVMIMADPRRMWRVFDNLLGNICKYAQPGTRVYLNIEESNGKCRIIFKNTSAKELDLSPEELMGRFVRGDKSREGAEGNGLGLSIATNLVQLQKGTMEIFIDGDLFKVQLEFPSES